MAENFRESVMPTPEDCANYIGLEHMDTGSLHVRRWGSVTELIGQKLRMRKGDILFARRNAYLRRVAIAPHDGLFSAHGMILRAKANVVLPEFLPFFMLSDAFMNRAEMISVGSLSPTINWTTLKLEEFRLPPIDQQRLLAEILWAADAHLQTVLDTVDAVVAAKASLLSDTFPRDGRFGCRIKGTISLQDLCGESITYGIVQAGPNIPGGIPYIRVTDMTNGPLRLEGTLRTTPAIAARFKRSTVRAGELVCALRGPAGLLKVVPQELDGANLTRGTARISLKDKSLTHYVLRAFESPFVEKQLGIQAKGSTFAELTLASLRRVSIPLLHDEQREILEDQLEMFDKASVVAADSSKSCQRLVANFTNSFST